MIKTAKKTRKELGDYATALPHGHELAHIVLELETCDTNYDGTLYLITLMDEGHEEDNPVVIAFGDSTKSKEDAMLNLQEDMRDYMEFSSRYGVNESHIAAIGLAMAYLAQTGKWQ